MNESIIKIRVALQNSKIKKSGRNSYAGFEYYELSDFLPKLNELMKDEKMNDIFTIEEGYAVLILTQGEEKQSYKMPFVIFDTPTNSRKNKETGEYEQVKQMQDIQYLGALNTYYKRYLYLNAFGITDGEVIDSMDTPEATPKNTTKVSPATQTQIEKIKKLAGQRLDAVIEFEKTTMENMSEEKANEIIKKLSGVK